MSNGAPGGAPSGHDWVASAAYEEHWGQRWTCIRCGAATSTEITASMYGVHHRPEPDKGLKFLVQGIGWADCAQYAVWRVHNS
jgi:hypothetical protein